MISPPRLITSLERPVRYYMHTRQDRWVGGVGGGGTDTSQTKHGKHKSADQLHSREDEGEREAVLAELAQEGLLGVVWCGGWGWVGGVWLVPGKSRYPCNPNHPC